MIDRFVNDIESEIHIDTVGKLGETPTSDDSGGDLPSISDSYMVVIAQDGSVIETLEDSTQSDLVASVVNYLIQNHDLINAIQPLPYILDKKRAVINDEPTYNDRQMKQPRELKEGCYLEVNLSWGQKKRGMERLADASGVGVTIQG